jgi:hypothetical protein
MTFINRICLAYLTPTLRRLDRARRDPVGVQRACLEELVRHGRGTAFGHEHRFEEIRSLADFQRRVPVRDYDAFQPYIDRLRAGERHVLWDQDVRWFARSSGTSSDKSKYIPVTPDNLRHCHMAGFTRMLASFLHAHPRSGILSGKALTLGGSVRVDEMGDGRACSGDLSAILLSCSPRVAEWARTPSREIALVADFQEKIAKICQACSRLDVTNFAGVPSWNLVLIHKLLEYNNARFLTDIWPNIELFMHGGINFEPYREQYRELIPSSAMRYVENYNASEGYFAFQDEESDPSMLLTLDNGVFYEFIPASRVDEITGGAPRELDTVASVVTGKPYALVISTNSGLWRYLVGDCVEFTSTFPHKIRITGRTKLYINAFGEELMIGNAERALAEACRACGAAVREYTVAPRYMTADRKGSHQWLIEFTESPADLDCFTDRLDAALRSVNSDYDAKRTANSTMLRPLVQSLPPGTFLRWMATRERLGGQNKVPRLSNDRHVVDEILSLLP